MDSGTRRSYFTCTLLEPGSCVMPRMPAMEDSAGAPAAGPGVRLKALDGLGDYVAGDLRVRNAVLEALMQDSNPGVRIEAIRLLESVKPDSSVRDAFRQLAQQDEDDYIRRESRRVLATLPELD